MDETRPCSYSRSATLGTDHKPRHSRSVHNGEMTLLTAHMRTLPARSIHVNFYSSLYLTIWTTTVQSSDPFLHHRRIRNPFFFAEGQRSCWPFCRTKSMTHLEDMRFGVRNSCDVYQVSTKPNRLVLPITASSKAHRVFTCEHWTATPVTSLKNECRILFQNEKGSELMDTPTWYE